MTMYEKKTKHLYNLKLGEAIGITSYLRAICVPGGWIFNFYNKKYIGIDRYELIHLSSTFVPISDKKFWRHRPCERCEQTGRDMQIRDPQTNQHIFCKECNGTGFIYKPI